MKEIAATLQAAGVPGGFHEAAAEIYHHMAGFKESPDTPTLHEVIGSLLT